MKVLFTNKLYFFILFFSILILDIFVKLNFESIPYRLISKPLVILSLFSFFLINNKTELKKDYIIIALLSFFIGDFFLIFDYINTLYITGIIFFIVGKLCYAKRFSNQQDFKIIRLLPFLIMCFAYMIFIMMLVLDNLGIFFLPSLVYLYSCLLVLLFAYLRKGVVNKKSYILVLIGVTITILCDSITLIQSFYYKDFPFYKIAIMLFYGISQYFIITGLVEEGNVRKEIVIL